MKLKPILFATLVLLGIFIASIVINTYQNKDKLTERQNMIHDRGSLVMPFDLDKTTHSFDKTPDGGIQQVRTKDSNDQEQILLIRSHLQGEAERFSQGDFGDPKTLHGEDMPGLDVLSVSQGKFTVTYQELSDGAQLSYLTDDPKIIDAFHLWFMAQMMDHGMDAMN